MSLKAFLIGILIAMVATPSSATKYMAGADDGWKLGLNYSALANARSIYIKGTHGMLNTVNSRVFGTPKIIER